MNGKAYSYSLFMVLGVLFSATPCRGAYQYDPLLQCISVRSVSGSGIITLRQVYPSGSGSATMTMIREKNQNDSAIVNITPSSPIEVTGVLGKEYEISVTRAKDLESGEDNQEFQISTVILIGNDSLSIPLGEVTDTSLTFTRRLDDTRVLETLNGGTWSWVSSGFRGIQLSPSTEYAVKFGNKDCLRSCTEIQVYATTLPASVVSTNLTDAQTDGMSLMCNWEAEPGSPQPPIYSVDWFRDGVQVHTSLIPGESETGLSATYVLGSGGSCVGSHHAVVAGVDRFGRKGGNSSTNAITIPIAELTGFQSVEAVAVSTSEILVSWVLGERCNEVAANISIAYTDSCQIVIQVDPSASEYRMTGLRPSTAYVFTVSASNELSTVQDTVQAVTQQTCVCAAEGGYVGGIVALCIFIVLSNVLTAVLTGCCAYKWWSKRDTHYVQPQRNAYDNSRDVSSAGSGYDEIQSIRRNVGAEVPVRPNPAYRPSKSNLVVEHEYMIPRSNPYAVPRRVEDGIKETAETSS